LVLINAIFDAKYSRLRATTDDVQSLLKAYN